MNPMSKTSTILLALSALISAIAMADPSARATHLSQNHAKVAWHYFR